MEAIIQRIPLLLWSKSLLTLTQLWPVGSPSSLFLPPWDKPLSLRSCMSMSTVLLSGMTRYFWLILHIPLLALESVIPLVGMTFANPDPGCYRTVIIPGSFWQTELANTHLHIVLIPAFPHSLSPFLHGETWVPTESTQYSLARCCNRRNVASGTLQPGCCVNKS